MQPRTTYTENADANGPQESTWVYLDAWIAGTISVQVNLYQDPMDPPVQYTCYQTLDDPTDPLNTIPVNQVTWFPFADANFVNSTIAAQTYFNSAPRFIKLVQTAGTGIALLTVTQQGSVTY